MILWTCAAQHNTRWVAREWVLSAKYWSYASQKIISQSGQGQPSWLGKCLCHGSKLICMLKAWSIIAVTRSSISKYATICFVSLDRILTHIWEIHKSFQAYQIQLHELYIWIHTTSIFSSTCLARIRLICLWLAKQTEAWIWLVIRKFLPRHSKERRSYALKEAESNMFSFTDCLIISSSHPHIMIERSVLPATLSAEVILRLQEWVYRLEQEPRLWDQWCFHMMMSRNMSGFEQRNLFR